MLAFISLFKVSGFAQMTDPILHSDTASCTIPFTLAGKIILIQATADTTQGNFILDTGAPGLVLNSTYFRDYPVIAAKETQHSDVTGGGGQMSQISVNHFTLGTMHYSRMTVDMVNLGALEQTRGVKILGLLGVSMFKECEIVIDYDNNVIELHHISRKEAKTYQHASLSDSSKFKTYPIGLRNNRILIDTKLAGRNLRFAIDYAAESSILDSRLPDKILDSVSIEGRILLSGAGSKKIEAISGALSGLYIGGENIQTLPVIITRLEHTCFGGMDCINGVLGYDFVSRHKVVINFRKRILYMFK